MISLRMESLVDMSKQKHATLHVCLIGTGLYKLLTMPWLERILIRATRLYCRCWEARRKRWKRRDFGGLILRLLIGGSRSGWHNRKGEDFFLAVGEAQTDSQSFSFAFRKSRTETDMSMRGSRASLGANPFVKLLLTISKFQFVGATTRCVMYGSAPTKVSHIYLLLCPYVLSKDISFNNV